MPSDSRVFDELKIPFIFVPHGAPDPSEWLASHPDYIKLPATFVPRGRGDGGTSPSSGRPSAGQRRTIDGLAPLPDPTAPWRPTENAVPNATQAGTNESSDRTLIGADPIAAYLRAERRIGDGGRRLCTRPGRRCGPGRLCGDSPAEPHGRARTCLRSDADCGESGAISTTGRRGRVRLVLLPNGRNVLDTDSPTGNLMSPVADLSVVAAAGRDTGAMYRSLLSNPDTAPDALTYFSQSLDANLGHGGTFDYQRQGNSVTGYTQLRQFKHVSNVNVGRFAQQAGLTLDEALSIAGGYAGLLSSNARPDQPHALDPTAARLITEGFGIGQSGVFGQPPAP